MSCVIFRVGKWLVHQMKDLIISQVFIRACGCVKRQYWGCNVQEYGKNGILGIFSMLPQVWVPISCILYMKLNIKMVGGQLYTYICDMKMVILSTGTFYGLWGSLCFFAVTTTGSGYVQTTRR